NPVFYAGRFVIYFLIWWALTSSLNSSSVRQDRTGDMREREKRAGLGAFGIVCLFITLTFAATDWIMSLDPRWYSTVFPAWLLIRFCDLLWTIMPFFHASNESVALGPIWMGIGAWLAMGGIWLFFFVNNIKKYPLIPSHGMLVSEEALEHA